MATISEAFALALQHHRAGRLQDAEAIYRQILAVEPNCADAIHLLGVLAHQAGNDAIAVQYIQRAIGLNGNSAAYHLNLGNALKDLGKLDEAVACYRRALALKPDFAGAHNNLGNALKEQGLLDEAVASYRRELDLKPDHVGAHNNLALALKDQGKLDEAIACLLHALELNPGFAEAHNNLGIALKDQGKLGEAIGCYHRALDLKPDFAEAHSNLGNALKDQGKLDQAVACCRRAIELKADAAEAHNNLGNALNEQGKVDEAIESFRRALELKPNYPDALNNLGNAWKTQDRLDAAVACYQRALQLKPDFVEVRNNLGIVFKDQGKPEEAVACFRQALESRPDLAELYSNVLYAQLFCLGCDCRALYEEHRRWNERYARPLVEFFHPHLNNRSSERRLTIGYVSPDFREHCQTLFILPLLASHDRGSFEIVCYSDVLRPDGATQRLQSHAGKWRNIAGLDHDQVATLVRQDGIDILVDLTMHMARNRLLVFARRPAPVQACWLAYPGTTGMPAIDYRISDPHLDPPGLFDGCYAEETVRLPDSFWCYDPLTSKPEVNSLPAAHKGHVSFGCLNNFCKVSPLVLELWAEVLKAVAGSRLTILTGEGTHRQQALDLLAKAGVSGDRVTFVTHRPRLEYLKYYHEIDIGLDTLPYNGHTTSLDSFWMGVPVVTCVGPTVVGRAGLCQLMNLDLPELIAQNPQQFVRIAANLAGDLPRLGALRATLRNRLQASPLMNAPRFARNMEAAFRAMWRRWCAGR
jgi:protein O-GlcNAc transferase